MSIYHHILNPKAAWNSHEATRDLRRTPELIPPMQPEYERAIHANIACVPLLDYTTAFWVRNNFEPVQGNFVATMYQFISTVEDSMKHPKASTLQKTLSALTAQAVELQIPYVKEGLIETDPLQPLILRTQDAQNGQW